MANESFNSIPLELSFNHGIVPKGACVSLKPYVLLFDEIYTDLYRISEAEDWMNKAQKIIFIGTSFSVNITSIALRIAISRGIKIDIVDPNPIKINYDKVNYHQMNAEEYSNFRNLN